jgi:hypothetical protein
MNQPDMDRPAYPRESAAGAGLPGACLCLGQSSGTFAAFAARRSATSNVANGN